MVRPAVNLPEWITNKYDDKASETITKQGPFMTKKTLQAKKAIKHDCIADCVLFTGGCEAFLRQLMEEVSIRIYKAGEYILKEGAHGDTCYFMNRGLVEVLVGPTELRVATLSGGSVFGELSLLGVTNRRSASIRALEFCDARVIHRKAFARILRLFPKERAQFRTLAEQRWAEIQAKKEEEALREKMGQSAGEESRGGSVSALQSIRGEGAERLRAMVQPAVPARRATGPGMKAIRLRRDEKPQTLDQMFSLAGSRPQTTPSAQQWPLALAPLCSSRPTSARPHSARHCAGGILSPRAPQSPRRSEASTVLPSPARPPMPPPPRQLMRRLCKLSIAEAAAVGEALRAKQACASKAAVNQSGSSSLGGHRRTCSDAQTWSKTPRQHDGGWTYR